MGYPVNATTRESRQDSFVKQVGSGLLRLGQTAANAAISAGKGIAASLTNGVGLNIPGLSGMSGLEEFFRLRYVINRFRDHGMDAISGKTTNYWLDKKYPDLAGLEDLAKNGKQFYDNVQVIYHDYDDDNHYEVIFDNFEMHKSKEDPETYYYTIEMTAIRGAKTAGYNPLNKTFVKEDPSQVLANFSKELGSILTDFRSVLNVPRSIDATLTSLYNGAGLVYNSLVDFANGVKSDWAPVIAIIQEIKNRAKLSMEINIRYHNGQISYNDYINELANLEDFTFVHDLLNDAMDVNPVLERLFTVTSQMEGIDKYYSDQEVAQTYNSDDNV
jgi:hypothetical protein